jgi:hypothetical protein
MGILSVATVATISASMAAILSWRSLRTGTTVRELSIWGLACVVIAAGILVYLILLTSMLGGDTIALLTPSIFGARPERSPLTFYAIGSAGIGILVTSWIARFTSRGKA